MHLIELQEKELEVAQDEKERNEHERTRDDVAHTTPQGMGLTVQCAEQLTCRRARASAERV